MDPIIVDVAIVGGGPAGMSAALAAGRARLRAIVVNEERARNFVTKASHGFLTRDGAHPAELLRLAKEELAAYPSVEYRVGHVASASHDGECFRLRLGQGEDILASRVLIATGHRDDLDRLRIEGLLDVYGTSVFPCPFCDGYEQSGKRLAIFGGHAGVEQYAAVVRMWSDDVAVFTNGVALSEEARSALARNGIPVYEDAIASLESKDGRLSGVWLADRGAIVERDAGFLWTQPGVPASPLADELGVKRGTNPQGIVTYEADEMGVTNVPGVYVVGDMRVGFAKIVGAAAEGAKAIQHVVHDIATRRWK